MTFLNHLPKDCSYQIILNNNLNYIDLISCSRVSKGSHSLIKNDELLAKLVNIKILPSNINLNDYIFNQIKNESDLIIRVKHYVSQLKKKENLFIQCAFKQAPYFTERKELYPTFLLKINQGLQCTEKRIKLVFQHTFIPSCCSDSKLPALNKTSPWRFKKASRPGEILGLPTSIKCSLVYFNLNHIPLTDLYAIGTIVCMLEKNPSSYNPDIAKVYLSELARITDEIDSTAAWNYVHGWGLDPTRELTQADYEKLTLLSDKDREMVDYMLEIPKNRALLSKRPKSDQYIDLEQFIRKKALDLNSRRK